MALAIPPHLKVRPSSRELVTRGYLVQRELVSYQELARLAENRALRTSGESQWEAWDRDGVLSPLAFHIGSRAHQHTVGSYPMEAPARDPDSGEWTHAGWIFRDEVGFAAWDEYRYEQDGYPTVQPLYWEWQLLALPIVMRFDVMPVPVTVLAGEDAELLEWA